MQALRRVISNALPTGVRGMGSGPSVSAEARWASYSPKAPEVSPAEQQKAIRKEMIGFLLLGRGLGLGLLMQLHDVSNT